MGPSGNLSGGQRFLVLDTGKPVVQNCWKELPMPSAVINRVNVLGRTEGSMLVFTDCLGRVIGNYTPKENVASEEDESIANDLYSSIPPAPAGRRQECPWLKKAALMKSQEWICLMLLL